MVIAIHWHESAMDLHVFSILIPPPTSLSILSLRVIPVHKPWALVSCIQPGLVICFTLDSILVSMLFSLNVPPSPSPTESIIQSEVSQKDKDHYSILTHIHGILKDGNYNPICKTEKETQMCRRVLLRGFKDACSPKTQLISFKLRNEQTNTWRFYTFYIIWRSLWHLPLPM